MEWLPLKNKQTKQQQQNTPKSQRSDSYVSHGGKMEEFSWKQVAEAGAPSGQ